MKKLSIIVAVYNIEKYLNKCLESVIKEKSNDIEIILVDDGSTDNSLKICLEYAQKDKRIQVIHQDNRKLSAVRNVGFQKSTGEYIWHIDGDDYLEDNYYSQIKEYFNQADIICFNYYEIRNNYKRRVQDNKDYDDDNKKYILSYCFAWNKIIRRNVLECEFFPENNHYNDIFLIPTLISKTKRILFVDKYLYNYVYHRESVSNTRKLAMNDLLYCLKNVKNKLYQEYPDEVECFYINNLLVFNLVKSLHTKIVFNFKEINYKMKEYFPHYDQNKYWNNSLTRKVYIRLIYKNKFKLVKLLTFVKIRLYNSIKKN